MCLSSTCFFTVLCLLLSLLLSSVLLFFFFFFQAEDGIRDHCVTGVQTCALPISLLDAHALGVERQIVAFRILPVDGEVALGDRALRLVAVADLRGDRVAVVRIDRKSVV